MEDSIGEVQGYVKSDVQPERKKWWFKKFYERGLPGQFAELKADESDKRSAWSDGDIAPSSSL